jgi:hypothetical protein
MADRNRRSSLWFWLLLLTLLAVVAVGVRAVTTADECEGRSSTWNWVPPGFECGPPR